MDGAVSACLLALTACFALAPQLIAQGDLTSGWTHTATIAPAGETDIWRFDAAAGTHITIRIGEISQTNTLSPRIVVLNPSGVQQDSASGATAAEVSLLATNTGTFTVRVDGVSATATGEYRITLVTVPGAVTFAPGDEGGPLTNAVEHTGTIETGDLDVWTFDAAPGDALTLRMGETASIGVFSPALWLYGPDGRLLDSSYGAVAAEVYFRATNSGTFTVIAADYSSGLAGSGPYRLTLAKTGSPVEISPGDEGGPLTNGFTHLGIIDAGDLDVWTFSATTGSSITLRIGETVSTGVFSPALWLYGPDGRLLDSAYGTVAAQVYFRATNSGTFTVIAADYSSGLAGTGPYQLSLSETGSSIVIAPGDEGGPLTNGVMHLGVLGAGDIDFWAFDGTAQESIIVSIGESNSTASLTPAIWLYGPDGRLLDSAYGAVAAQVYFRATNSGTFTIVAGDYSSGFAGQGTYRLTLAKTGTPVEVSPGDEGGRLTGVNEYTGSIDAGDIDVWSFTLCAEETVSVRMDESVAGSALTPFARLFGRDGTLLRTVYAGSATAFSFQSTNSGTYLLVLGDNSSGYAGTGDYHVTVNGLSHEFRLCDPRVVGTNLLLSGVGGIAGAELVVHTSPLADAPLEIWMPAFTNQFDLYGTFVRTNAFDKNHPQRFYILEQR